MLIINNLMNFDSYILLRVKGVFEFPATLGYIPREVDFT